MKSSILSAFLGFALIVNPLAALAQDASSVIAQADLTKNLEYLFPKSTYLSSLEFHSNWRELERRTMAETQGIEITYEAVFDQVPEFDDELPTLNAYVLPRASRAAAQAQLESWAKSPNFSNGNWTKLSEGRDYFTYLSHSFTQNDLVKYRPLEEASLHWVSYYDNVMMVVNFYRPSGEYLKNNVSAYLSYLAGSEETLSVLQELVVFVEEALKFYTGTTFSVRAPGDQDYAPSSASFNEEVSKEVNFPLNGTVEFQLYIDDASEIGTILDMSGIAAASPGMWSVGLNESALIELNMFDNRVNSGCRDEKGWHHVFAETPLNLYEWQTVKVGYGVMEGLKLWVNGELEASCDVRTARAVGPVYLGDYPKDKVAESFVGYVKKIKSEFSVSGDVRLDDLEGELIFADVSEAHPNAAAIQYVKDEKIMIGYNDGTFRPYQFVNRVEILKTLLVGFKVEVPANTKKPKLSDVEEGAWYLPYLNYALDHKIVSGYANGTYAPAGAMNRAEFLKILLNAYGAPVNDYGVTELYPDVPKDAWYASYVQYAKDKKLMDPDSSGRFNPGAEVSRAEVAETLYRLLK